MKALTFQLHPEVEQYEHDIRRFVDAMLYKLRRNANKGRWENLSVAKATEMLQDEVVELNDAIEDGNSIEIILEAADVANFAMITASITTEKGQ